MPPYQLRITNYQLSLHKRRERRPPSASSPGDLPLRLREHNALQKANGFLQSLALRHQAVFVLDRERAVIAAHPQHRDKVAPEMAWIAETDGAENPGAV